MLRHINRSIISISTTFILTNNNWTTCFDCYSVILGSFSMVVSYGELCAHLDPKCVYIKTWAIYMHRGLKQGVCVLLIKMIVKLCKIHDRLCVSWSSWQESHRLAHILMVWCVVFLFGNVHKPTRLLPGRPRYAQFIMYFTQFYNHFN